jgi:hypothetical protein
MPDDPHGEAGRDPRTSRFSRRVISLGVIVAMALLLGAIDLIWPGSIGDFARELQSGP